MDDGRLANLAAVAALGLTDRVSEAITAESGLDPMSATALLTLLDFTPAGSVHRLAQGLGLSHSGAVRLVDRLVDAELVGRGPGPDQRSVTITLTKNGKSLARRLRRTREREVDGALLGLSDRQRRELTKAYELVIANLTRDRLAQRSAGRSPAGGGLCRMCDFTACGRPDGQCPTARETGYQS